MTQAIDSKKKQLGSNFPQHLRGAATMNHLNRIFNTALALQSSRSFGRDIKGFEKLPEAETFAKACGEALACGVPPKEVVNQIELAMGGNSKMANELFAGVETLAKAHAEKSNLSHEFEYEAARHKAMEATSAAHGAGLHAMAAKTSEAHDNAATLHRAAAEHHAKALNLSPHDRPEIGIEHSKLSGQHALGEEWHHHEAKHLRDNLAYAKISEKALRSEEETEKHSASPRVAIIGHRATEELHRKAAQLRPEADHLEKAEEHAHKAEAIEAADLAESSPHFSGNARENGTLQEGVEASRDAANATFKAYEDGSHEDAAHRHAQAMEKHLNIHAKREGTEDGHHKVIAHKHMKLHLHHLSKIHRKEEIAKAVQDWNAEARHKLKEGKISGQFAGPHESFPINSPKDITHAYELAHHAEHPEEIKANLRRIAKEKGWEHHLPEEEEEKMKGKEETAKADGAPAMEPQQEPPTPGYDLSQQTGTNAMMVEGRPDDFRNINKSEVAPFTRIVNGKPEQVGGYETTRALANEASTAAHAATAHAAKQTIGSDEHFHAHRLASFLHGEAGKHHMHAHSIGHGEGHPEAEGHALHAAHHFASETQHSKAHREGQGHTQHLSARADALTGHADSHQLEETPGSHQAHFTKHHLAMEAHGRAEHAHHEEATKHAAGSAEHKHHSEAEKHHHEKSQHHLSEMNKAARERRRRAESANTMSEKAKTPEGHLKAMHAHTEAAKVQFEPGMREYHTQKAKEHLDASTKA